MGVKLNLGAGNCPLPDYQNLDIKNGDSIYPLLYSDVEEIRASHVLEHFDTDTSVDVIISWVKALSVGGVLKIAVPDFEEISRRYLNGSQENIEGYVMGGQTDSDDYHHSIWDNRKLRTIMEGVGLTDIRTWQSEIDDCASLGVSLNLRGIKRGEGDSSM